MRILSTVFFLSFLAGKFATFERMLPTEPINLFGKTKRMRLWASLFGGILKILNYCYQGKCAEK